MYSKGGAQSLAAGVLFVSGFRVLLFGASVSLSQPGSNRCIVKANLKIALLHGQVLQPEIPLCVPAGDAVHRVGVLEAAGMDRGLGNVLGHTGKMRGLDELLYFF